MRGIPLRRLIWLTSFPAFLIWDVSGGCMLTACAAQLTSNGIIEPLLGLAFTVSSVAMALLSIAIWRASARQRETRSLWCRIGARAYAIATGFCGIVSLVALMWVAASWA
jgi:hypothetical protein